MHPQVLRPADGTVGVGRSDHDGHLADGGPIELKPLTALESRRAHDLHLDELLVVRADPVDRLGAEQDPAPEFSDLEFSGARYAGKYIVSGAPCKRAAR